MKNIKLILTAVFVASMVTGCLVDDEENTSFAESPYVIGFETSFANESYFEDLGVVEANYPLNVLGGGDGTPIENDIVVNYEIASSSTAVEGQEFDFVDNSGTLTIPAGSTFVNFPLNINTGNFDPNTPTSLILKLTGTNGDSSVISELNDELAITFVGCQSQLNQYTYQVTTTRDADGGVENSQLETISLLSVNTFRTATVGPFGPGARRGDIGGTNGFTFEDVCGTITISSQNLVSLYSNQVYGTGEVDPETGNITFKYAITFSGAPTFYTSVFVRQ
ncbi:MAG: hypothetical protein CMF34_13730 [Leeuwenhoekiella sp.]|uniref:hypothetical protein n=1 Tax=unclassified Leeuwenhoekiella TaxID=2615029 RepID=UPI000C52551D|nr:MULTISPECIES: hypothetical protein [unclassified Leeuwenhoekiella]MAS21293.1 hypothetical protein [Leeuwenhoekiella sp.]MAW93933.1 hypothetical protein [Leeuwenhoekiella sp.]MBA81653.1 hypothetical protein [Leeuwenhoekiella sp.]|tara:strand:+ start:6815 stop:7651 length:837 start_codon:yes stop_codon:yes gene_type:complete